MEFPEFTSMSTNTLLTFNEKLHIWRVGDGHAALHDAIHRYCKKTLSTLLAATWVALQPREPSSSIFMSLIILTVSPGMSEVVSHYRTSIFSTSSLASFHVSRFFLAQSMWHRAYASYTCCQSLIYSGDSVSITIYRLRSSSFSC